LHQRPRSRSPSDSALPPRSHYAHFAHENGLRNRAEQEILPLRFSATAPTWKSRSGSNATTGMGMDPPGESPRGARERVRKPASACLTAQPGTDLRR
jgi:hypothetical protein